MRVKDETMVDLDDEEIMQDAATDEFASYFEGQTVPKVLFTTCNRPRNHVSLVQDKPQQNMIKGNIVIVIFTLKLKTFKNFKNGPYLYEKGQKIREFCVTT